MSERDLPLFSPKSLQYPSLHLIFKLFAVYFVYGVRSILIHDRFHCFRNLHTVLHSGCTQLSFPASVERGSLSAHCLCFVLFVEVLTMAILTSAWLYIVVVLLSSSPIIIDVDMFLCDFFQRSELSLPLGNQLLECLSCFECFCNGHPRTFLEGR